jgi:Trypsin
MGPGWRYDNEWAMNIASMRTYFYIARAATAFLRARKLGSRKILAWLFAVALAGPAQALVGPAREAPEFAPYVVMVMKWSGGEADFCSASVIARDIVLTAAHCITDLSDTRVFFRDSQGEVVPFDVASIAIHPNFQPNIGRQHLISIDLALVRLVTPLPPSFKPVRLSDIGVVRIGELLRIVGFGRANERTSGTSGVLREGVVVTNGPKSPALVWLKDPNDTGLGGCTGDSGAPVFALDEPRLVAVAIKAKGENGFFCGAMTEAVQITPQMPWIRKTLQAWGATGRAAP